MYYEYLSTKNMDALHAIFTRRSIRKFTPDIINDDDLNIILKAGMYAPSAVNKQPWHFIVFRNTDTIKRIIEVHPNASPMLGANVCILVCYDEELQHDNGYGAVDCSAATQNMLLAAHAIGLGAVWLGIYPRQPRMEAISEIFRLPGHVKGFSIVALGYPDEKKPEPNRFNSGKVHDEQW